jgi:hypothetical protein
MHRYSSLGAMEMKKEKKSTTVLDLLFRPPATFLKMYLVQQGFREGWRGFLLSCLYGMYTFSKYAKYWEMKKNTALKNKNYNR